MSTLRRLVVGPKEALGKQIRSTLVLPTYLALVVYLPIALPSK